MHLLSIGPGGEALMRLANYSRVLRHEKNRDLQHDTWGSKPSGSQFYLLCLMKPVQCRSGFKRAVCHEIKQGTPVVQVPFPASFQRVLLSSHVERELITHYSPSYQNPAVICKGSEQLR